MDDDSFEEIYPGRSMYLLLNILHDMKIEYTDIYNPSEFGEILERGDIIGVDGNVIYPVF